MDKEIWKDIPGYEGEYQASNMGRIRSLTRKLERQSNHCKEPYSVTYWGRILSPRKNSNGYFGVSLRSISQRVHRIVAQTWIPNPNNLRDVNHKNGIKTDNRVENLEWVSHSDNEIHKIYELKTPGKLIKPMRKVECIETGKVFTSISDACRKMGLKTNHISEACSGKLKQTCGYHWRYADGS